MARILVYTPTYDNMLRPETVASVQAQEFNGELVHVIDDRNLHEGRSMKEVCEKYRDARLQALDGGYDALLCVEHDMVLPPGCVQALWDTPAPVVYAAYMLRHGTRVINMFRKDAGTNIGMSLSLYPKEYWQAKKQVVIEVSGGGFGCTLMRREALERCPFHVFEDNPPDMAFAADCLRAHVKQMGRFDVACLHIDGRKGVLNIEDGGGSVVRVLALQDVAINIEQESKALKRGRYYSIPLDVAREQARAGYVRITSEMPPELEVADAPPPYVAEPAVMKRRTPPKPATRKKTKNAVSRDSD